MIERIHYETREDWLAGRSIGIGASEAAAAIGMSPWMTPVTLWRQKMGLERPKDLSDNAAVQQGVRMEPALREFFKALHPELKVMHYPFDILRQKEKPWLFATLDGELLRTSNADSPVSGILEIKTATPNSKAGWEEWSNGRMKQTYYVQALHQLLATGWDFVILFAALYGRNGDITLREYEVNREDVQEDLAWLLEEETRFWRYIEKGAMPPAPLM